MNAIILDFVAAQRRAACPLQAPRLAAALVAVGMAYALAPITIAAAFVAGFQEAQRASLRVLP